jgi:outer membrane protein assembly factor BamB
VVVHEGGYTLALHDGKPRWKASTGGSGPLATDGTRVLGFSTGLREGDPPGVLEVSAINGELRWRTPLPVDVDDIELALGGAWLAVAYEQTVMLLPLPPA